MDWSTQRLGERIEATLNFDELLRLAQGAGGTGVPLSPRGIPPVVGPVAPMPPQPMPPTGPPVPVPPLQQPANASDALGPPGLLERVAGASEAFPIISPISGLLDAVAAIAGQRTGYENYTRRAGIDTLQAQLDEQARKESAAKRAQVIADASKRASDRQARLQDRIDAADARSNILSQLEQTPEVVAEQKQLAQAKAGWQSAQAKILADEALAGAPSPITPSGGQRAGTVKPGSSTTTSDDALLDRIAAGTYPPDVLSGRMTEKKAALLGRMALLHPEFNLTDAVASWQARTKFTGTINNRQFTLLRSAQDSLEKLLKPVQDANDAVRASSGLSFSPTLNKWVLSPFAREGGRGRKAQQALAQRKSAATQAVEPLAQIFIAGGQPTDEAFQLAQAVLSVDDSTPPDVLDDQLATVAPGMKIRDVGFRSQEPQVPGIAKPSQRPDSSAVPGNAPRESVTFTDGRNQFILTDPAKIAEARRRAAKPGSSIKEVK